MFDKEVQEIKDFELVLLDRDNEGKPTGRKVSMSSNSGSEIFDFFEQHEQLMKNKQRKHRNKNRNKKRNKR